MKMNALVTIGGTRERIDNVRNISNVSTGRLGSLIAERLAMCPDIEKVYCVCGMAAKAPQSEKITLIGVDDVSSLEAAVKNLLGRESMDIVIHSMAVSDYRVKKVTSLKLLSEIPAGDASLTMLPGQNDAGAVMASIISRAGSALKSDGKISSDVDDLMLIMERTPKIISMFKALSPGSVLVGFKLLDGVPLDTLIDKGYEVLTLNGCDFVLANDLKEISDERHVGYLIDKEKNYVRYASKKDIAEAIVRAVLNERRVKL